MGAPATASVARASTGAPPGASASAKSAAPVVSGLPAFMTVTSGGKAQGRIEALKQQEQTEDRSVAEDLADRIGQDDARETMQAEDARQAAKTAAAQQDQSVAAEVAEDTHEAFSRAQEPQDAVSRTDDGNGSGLVGPGAKDATSGDDPSSEEDGATRGDGQGAGGGASPGGHGGGTAEGAGQGAAGPAAGGPGAAGPDGAKGDGASGAGAGKGRADGPVAEDVPRDGGPAEAPDTDAGALGTDDLVLIDVELAEHQRWAAAADVVGAAGSVERAEFIAQTAGGAFIGGVASGAAMGLEIGLISRAVPQLGAIMGGKQALDSLLERDWDATGATIGKFGQGSDIYDTLANTLASVNEVITIVNNICDYIGGIVAVVEAAAIAVAAGSAVLAFFTFGATAGIAIEAGELADVCEEVREAVGEVSTILNEISNHLLQPCILLFRALHEFTADADPREIEAGGHELSGAAGAVGGALGGWIGGQAAHIGGHAPPNDGEGTQQRPPHETPPAPEGLAPEVHFQEPPASTALPGATPEIETPAPAAQERAPMQVADSEILPPAPAAAAAPQASSSAAPADAAAAPAEQLNLANMLPPVGNTGGKLESPMAPISLKSFGSGGPVPKSLEPGAIGTYEVGVANPHPVALESNPPGAPGATRGGGRMPQEGRDAAGVYGEHQAPAATMGRTLPGYEYASPAGVKRAGSGTKEALAISFPKSAKRTKDRLDKQLHKDVKRRQDNNEDVMWAEVVARGARNSQNAIAASGANVPPEQISKAFLAEMETSQTDPKFGFQEFRPGDQLPKDSPLRGLTDTEISNHLDNLFGEHEFPMPPKGGQFEMFPGAPKPPASPPAANDTQLSIPGTDQPPVPAGQGDLFAPRAATPEMAGTTLAADAPMQVADQPATRGVDPLGADHRQSLREKAIAMGHDPDKISFTDGPTEFDPRTGELRIGPNVVPLPRSQRPERLANPANAELDEDSVLAHEIYGHSEAAQGKASRPASWHEEFQASIRAALLWKQATPEQRSTLMRDAAARRRGQSDDTVFVDTGRYGAAADAEAPRRSAASGGDAGDHEPSVIIDPSLYEPVPDTEAPQSIAPEQPAAPPAGSQAAPATPAVPRATVPAAPRASTGRGGGAAAAPPSLGGRVAKLFFPQESGGEGKAPTYAQQQAAHRAEFTDDNQPAAGVERVNPNYSPPPGTPDQIVVLQNEILNLLAVRARAEAESQHEGQRIEACEANRAPITATLATTHGGLGAVRAHEQAVARHDAANQAQQQRQQEAAAKTGGYADQAAGMGVIEAPLAAWEGFTSLASHLPGSAGDKMAAMNAEAKKMQDAFGQMGSHMLGADGEQPARAAALAEDSARIDATGAQAQASHQDLQSSADGAAGLQSANNETLAAAQQRQQAADQRGEELQSAADDRQSAADSLAAQMQAWAQAHRDERAQAVADTVARLQAQGKIVTQSPTE